MTGKHTQTHTYDFNETWLSGGLGNGCHGDSRCSIWGSCWCVFPAPCFPPLWCSSPLSNTAHRGALTQIFHSHLIMHPLYYIFHWRQCFIQDVKLLSLVFKAKLCLKHFLNKAILIALFNFCVSMTCFAVDVDACTLYKYMHVEFHICQHQQATWAACLWWWGGGHWTNHTKGSQPLAIAATTHCLPSIISSRSFVPNTRLLWGQMSLTCLCCP